MRSELLIGTLLTTTGFTLATLLQPGMDSWARGRRQSDSFLGAFMGESQKMFANHFFIKADAYFHSGYYPSIFEHTPVDREVHILGQATSSPLTPLSTGGSSETKDEDHHEDKDTHRGHSHAHGEGDHHDHDDHDEADEGFMGKPKDWLEAFGRHFRPNRHVHLGAEVDEDGDEHEHEHDHDHESEAASSQGLEREMLPWLKLSASMDPNRVQTYVVGAYFLRNLKRDKEAEAFLREGLKANPKSYEILFELGRLMNESRNDVQKACNIWEASIRFWREQEGTKPSDQQNLLPYVSMLAQIAKVEEGRGRFDEAAGHLKDLMEVSASKDAVRKWLEDVESKSPKR